MNFIVNRVLETTRQLWSIKTAVESVEPNRRNFLSLGTGLAFAAPVLLSGLSLQPSRAVAQVGRNTSGSRAITVAQIVDISTMQQDVSKDFLIGCRAAWQDINANGGLRGRNINHLVLETNGSAQSLQAAWEQLQNNPQCVAISGCTADPLATQLNSLVRNDRLGLANVAPWMQNSSIDVAPHTFAIFSNREEQISHALKTLSNLNMASLAVVFASQQDRQQNLADVQRIAQKQNLNLQELPMLADLVEAGKAVSSTTAAVVLFVGGTPELAQFTQGLDQQARQRYVVALADVNLQVLQQLSGSRKTSVIATQAVPMVSSAMPVVRNYRQVMTKLYDEPLTSLSLAGFIAAHYTFEVMQTIETPVTRSAVLDAFTRRLATNVGGFRVAYEAQRRSSAYVTQSMLSSDGRVIG
jgi:ABC-type branched-subunit amino acid transport system substrate-binding protein